jgi:hypothetical protein
VQSRQPQRRRRSTLEVDHRKGIWSRSQSKFTAIGATSLEHSRTCARFNPPILDTLLPNRLSEQTGTHLIVEKIWFVFVPTPRTFGFWFPKTRNRGFFVSGPNFYVKLD